MIEKVGYGLERASGLSTKDVAEALGLMLGSGLKTFGNQPGVDGWFLVLSSRSVNKPELVSAVEHFCMKGGEIPAAGEFVRWIVDRRRDVQLQAALEAEIARQDAETAREREERFLAVYGTANPTKEQIDARLKARFGGSAFRAVADKFEFSANRQELVDEAQQRKIERQIAEMRERP